MGTVATAVPIHFVKSLHFFKIIFGNILTNSCICGMIYERLTIGGDIGLAAS